MPVTGYWYPKCIEHFGQATFDWVADSASIKCALMATNFTGANQSLSLADYWNDVSAYEITSFTNYTASGKTVGTTTVSAYSTSNKTVKFSAGTSVVWGTATLTTRGAVVYKDTGTPATSPVVFFLDFGADVSPSGGDLTITWNTDGMATITTS